MDATAADLVVEAVRERECRHPIRVTDEHGTEMWARCMSREAATCPSCSRLVVGDWSAIARSGVFSAAAPGRYRWMLLTLTAPSFGAVHHVPRAHRRPRRCPCGQVHDPDEAPLRGTPLDPDTYDYDGQVAWNNAVGRLWDRTHTRLERAMPGLSYFAVKEWQTRGTVHLHVILRIPAAAVLTRSVVERIAQESATTVPWTREHIGWGAQVDCRSLGGPGRATARSLGYVLKAVSYSVKDIAGGRASPQATHARRLADAARAMVCGTDCQGAGCGNPAHRHYGSSTRIVVTDRAWSFTGLTRKRIREDRRQWALAHPAEHELWRDDAQRRLQFADQIARVLSLPRDSFVGRQQPVLLKQTQAGSGVPEVILECIKSG